MGASPRDGDPGAPAVALQRELSSENFELWPFGGQAGERVAFVQATFTAKWKSW